MNYQTATVNIAAFSTTITFVPNGQNFSFVIQNDNICGEFGCFTGKDFTSGASCEGSFSQSASGNPAVNNVFAMMFDSYGAETGSTFTYSNVQIYQQYQSPCNPASISGPAWPYWSTTKFSTSPVPLNSPAGTQNTSTGDTYSATITYDGSNVTVNLYDVTAGGSCPGASCYTHTWSNVSIPSQVDGTTAYIGLATSTGEGSSYPLYIRGWSYTANTPTATPGSTATSAGASTAVNPTFSPAPGTYSSAQDVTITCPTTAASAPIYILGTGSLPLYPLGNNIGGVAVGTAYSSPIAISSTNTLYAICSVNNNDNAGYLSSGVVSGTYTISGGTPQASAPTFSPAAGTYASAQSVSISDATSGATIYYTTNGNTPTTSSTQYTGPITVSSTETLQAIAVASGDSNSGVASAAYTIDVPWFPRRPSPPPGGPIPLAQSVTLSDATSGTTIYYTTDGSTPTTSSTVYTGPITVSSTETLKAIAAVTGDPQRGRVRGLHHNPATCSLDADLLTRRGDLYLCAVGDALRCHLGRNHLLHDQRNYADDVLDRVHRPDYGELDGDAGGDRGSHGRHQQRGRVRYLHHNAGGFHAGLLTRCRDLYLCAVGDPLRCHLGRNHLLHDQRNYAYHVLDQVHRPHYG